MPRLSALQWWVVWVSRKDNEFHCCHGYSEFAATNTAQVMMEKYALKQDLRGATITMLQPGSIPHMLLSGAKTYRDPDEPNPLNFAVQAWALQAPSRNKAIVLCRKEWKKNQLKEVNQ